MPLLAKEKKEQIIKEQEQKTLDWLQKRGLYGVPIFTNMMERRENKKKLKKQPRIVKLWIMEYDTARSEYNVTEHRVHYENLPPDAVHITGRKGQYFLDLVKLGNPPSPAEITAVDLNLYMVNNDINDALAHNWAGDKFDLKRAAIYGAIGIVAVIIIWPMLGFK